MTKKWWTETDLGVYNGVTIRVFLWPVDRAIAITKRPTENAFLMSHRTNRVTKITEGETIWVPTWDIVSEGHTVGEFVSEVIDADDTVRYVGVFRIEGRPQYIGIVGTDNDFDIVQDFHDFVSRKNIK